MDHPQVTNLYKYREFASRTLSMLANNELYFANSGSFNDPFDCRARREFEFKDDEEFLQQMSVLEARHQRMPVEEARIVLEGIIKTEKINEYLKEKSDIFQKNVLQSFGICTFSLIPDHILMWSHYSDGHNGFCIKFNRSPDNLLSHAKPIDYPENDEYPSIDYFADLDNAPMDELIKLVITKSRHWDYENEWRCVDSPEHPDNYMGHSVSYPNEMLSGIIFGTRMCDRDRNTIRNILNGKSVVFYEARPVKNKFRLEIVSV